MAEDLKVTTALEQGVVVLTVSYGPELMLTNTASKKLSEELVGAYQKETGKNGSANTGSCVVIIEAQTAGSPLVRALFELYKTVSADGGQVICIGFPSDYIDSLTTLGLTALPGFTLAGKKEEALSKLATK